MLGALDLTLLGVDNTSLALIGYSKMIGLIASSFFSDLCCYVEGLFPYGSWRSYTNA